MARKTSTLREQAEKQIRRLEKATRRAEKRGYVFDLPFRRTKTGEPKTRYTRKEVERLSQLHLKDLYKYSKYGSERYGYVSGEEYRKQERKWQAREASYARWEKERKRRQRLEQIERERFYKELYPERYFVSVSKTIIDNAMERKNWRWSDKYYEQFMQVVNKARAINEDLTAQAFQDMINDGVLVGIQKDYKPEDFWVDYSTFSDYFENIVPESREIMSNIMASEAEDIDEYYDEDFEGMSDEEREFYIDAFGGR